MTEDEARALILAALITDDTAVIWAAFDRAIAAGFPHLVEPYVHGFE